MTELSTRAALVVGLAIVALLLSGRRKPARAWRPTPRDRRAIALNHRGQPVVVPVDHRDARIYRRTPLWRRIVAAGGLGVITVVGGALAAVATAVGVAWLVTTVTGRLR
jgi:hypothetical protein